MPIQESCAGTLCENDTAPSPIQLQIAEDTLPQEGVDHESMCYRRVEIFEGGTFRAIQDFALFRKFCGY